MVSIQLKGFGNIKDIEEGRVKATVRNIPLENIVPGKYQTRKTFDQESLDELAQSIKSQGVIQPIIVRSVDDRYEIIAGERRWRASRIAGLDTIPAIVKAIDDSTALAYTIVENLQREGLNAVDEALSFKRLKDEFELTHEQIGEWVGKSRTAVTNAFRLLNLPTQIQNKIIDGKIEAGHAKVLVSLNNDDQQLILNQIMEKKLSVREVELKVQKIQQKKKTANYLDGIPISLERKLKIKPNRDNGLDLTIKSTSKEDLIDTIERIHLFLKD